jgi:glycosyltransferase involved in cell wall biosynthesis
LAGPFGLIMIEAMACGTPVIALRRGSVPEVVEHGVSGLSSTTLSKPSPQYVISRTSIALPFAQHSSAALPPSAW